MKRFLIIVPALFATVAMAQLPFQQRQAAAQGDAVSVDPSTHHVLLDNDHVRVFRAQASPGHSSPRHTHPPSVLVSLDRARFRQTLPDGSNEIFDFHPGQVVWLDGFEHSWELLSGEAHVIGVEVKAAATDTRVGTVTRPATDAVAVDPVHHHVTLDNDHVRVFQALAAPGASSPMHTHPPFVLISHARARLRLNTGGETQIFELEPGQVLWLEDAHHSWELLAGDLEVTAVEVKAATPRPTRP